MRILEGILSRSFLSSILYYPPTAFKALLDALSFLFHLSQSPRSHYMLVLNLGTLWYWRINIHPGASPYGLAIDSI